MVKLYRKGVGIERNAYTPSQVLDSYTEKKIKIKDSKQQETKTQNSKLKTQNSKTQNSKPKNSKPKNSKTQNPKLKNSKLKTQNSKPKTQKLKNSKIKLLTTSIPSVFLKKAGRAPQYSRESTLLEPFRKRNIDANHIYN